MKYTIQEYYDMTDDQFREIYENRSFKNILEFIETRIRLEILSIIRRFQLKGEVLFEVRQKSTSSAYSKLQKELVARQSEFGSKPIYIFDVLKDLVGVRIICLHEEIQKRVFEYILQVESIVIQPEGLEFYSARFRDYTLSRDIHDQLMDIIKGVKRSWVSESELEKKSKASNYESLHFYVKFESKIDDYLLRQLARGRRGASEGERVRDRAEGDYLIDLHGSFTDEQLDQIRKVPVECQVRTITDHLWAQEEHKYVYKSSSLPLNTDERAKAMEVLRGTFTGLKFAYYNVDRLRSLVRNVSATHETPETAYAGSSKDINPVRFRYFPDDRKDLVAQFRAVEGLFLKSGKDMAGDLDDGTAFLDSIISLYDQVVSIDQTGGEKPTAPFDTESWGRRRLFYLLLAYMALSTSRKRVNPETAQRLRDEIDLIDLVGEAAFRASMYDEEGSVKLASKIYERIETFDRIARTLTEKEDTAADERSEVFLDPLVGIRLASSFFIQGEFAGASKAMRDMFDVSGKNDLTSWSELELGADFSLSEILMRYSQYVFFENFDEEDKLQDDFLLLQEIFGQVFELPNDDFCPELYRCYAWYYSLVNYLFTQSSLVPTKLADFKTKARNYLIEFHKEATESLVSSKPETLLVEIYLPIHMHGEEEREEKIGEAYAKFTELMQNFHSYPRSAVVYLSRMASKIKDRTREKSTREYDSTFISYSRKDIDLVKSVVDHLKGHGIKVRFDQDFEKGFGISGQVERAMLGANSAVLVVTPDYLRSEWAAEERAFLMDKRRRKELRLFVLRYNVDDADILEKAPLLAGILGYTADNDTLGGTVAEMAEGISRALSGSAS
ncbi:MAG: TIR domain-containing protein [Phyllobacteriaceae bacterium]|jgi:ppGpp synthetase/RelA/SpoT-type nucleotidyltranferase|nr:TIR domain-containing protein [Phyllobacteriaceae bacterium]